MLTPGRLSSSSASIAVTYPDDSTLRVSRTVILVRTGSTEAFITCANTDTGKIRKMKNNILERVDENLSIIPCPV
jgi:hypothetical protein